MRPGRCVTVCIRRPARRRPFVNTNVGFYPSPPPDNGTIASAEPGILHAPDDWILSVSAKDEVLLPVAPLTTALSSREYLASGTFMGTIQGSSRTKPTEGELEAGYQIGCGITADVVDLRFGGGLTPTLSPAGVPSLGVAHLRKSAPRSSRAP